MDFGIGFISTNIMLPILDFFYGIVPSYGFGIIALTLVVRFAVYPLSAGQIRNMRKMRITQPLMKERQAEIQKKYKDNPQKQQEEMGKLMQELGNPLAGCLPLLLQMPILFALFATLRGSPFADINYTVDVQIFPQEQIERIQPQPFATKAQNVFINDGVHNRISAILPAGNKLVVGEKEQIELQTTEGKSLQSIVSEYSDSHLQPRWEVTKGQERVMVTEDGEIQALSTGDATIQITIPGIAADKGFLFIKALGRVGVVGDDGTINWDILGMVIFFGFSIYLNQELSGGGQNTGGNEQQQTVNKITPVIFSGMFLFFPLPAGVLMYIVIANVFQTIQTLILMREPLPENLQKIVAEREKANKTRDNLPFEKKNLKKKEKTS
ncbi:membrane protein insertase YidC [Cyanobacterium aponinum UTEX 3222]|uniref:Membrane protein insertase YidC n=2 Tax=Cyanobacterium aponinum TaxID=379064 RepID=A0A844GQW2_9CHRO|nr:membrane protein insertase YidC [Cyanobacterium aponinum]WRL41858.1 membrane protein insertase YidC [Cyanobacterium aponinum UTEX 3222]MBD2394840.1 membrane protein insertase YidC [Cyanobacterium aponinum FACHB-4101]MTF38934.1 membrane protein insertase YidC [Cyanobacterium aponinum 0216]PHV62764.1 membrane protein insertase YidC [Cyanobacterium aponinum IPPAS B-1201]WPF90034.1 membrane protein insertase YidC [Cyanobacterium aponinum AL20115]